MCLGLRSIGLLWFNTWRLLFSEEERKEHVFKAYEIYLSHILRQRGALYLSVQLYNEELSVWQTCNYVPTSEIITNDNNLPLNVEEHSILHGKCVCCQEMLMYEKLLCKVASEHFHWATALETLFTIFGDMEIHEEHHTHYSYEVQRSLLTLLHRSPKNMSNSALRLRNLQMNSQAWDLDADLSLLTLLLRARRWKIALTHIKQALLMPYVTNVKKLISTFSSLATFNTITYNERKLKQETSANISNATESNVEICNLHTKVRNTELLNKRQAHEVLCYANLLINALQACAIGGCTHEAMSYYDAFKDVVNFAQLSLRESRSNENNTNRSGYDNVKTENSEKNGDVIVQEHILRELCSTTELQEKEAVSEIRCNVCYTNEHNNNVSSEKCSSNDECNISDEAIKPIAACQKSNVDMIEQALTMASFTPHPSNNCETNESLELAARSSDLFTYTSPSERKDIVMLHGTKMQICCEWLVNELNKREPRARALFFRAMTKKLLSHSNKN